MKSVRTSDYFAELYVAGRLADSGWNVYFPHRDQGFDFIISKLSDTGNQLIRPVQVKGKYPTEDKGDKITYGYVGKLTQLHPDMILAIPFFSYASSNMPTCTAYLPQSLVRKHSRGYRCQPATYKVGRATPRRDYKKFFDESGIRLLENDDWRNLGSGID